MKDKIISAFNIMMNSQLIFLINLYGDQFNNSHIHVKKDITDLFSSMRIMYDNIIYAISGEFFDEE